MHLLWLSVALHIEYFSSILPPLQDIYHAVLKISAKSQNKKVLLERQRYHNLAWSSLSSSSFSTDPSSDLAPGKIDQTWVLSKILRCRFFRHKLLHRQFHLISSVLVMKSQKNKCEWRNLHRWQIFYTAAGSDGRDKSHLWHEPRTFGKRHSPFNQFCSKELLL